MKDNNGDSTELQGRILYCDCLRIIATFAVIILHISAQDKITLEVGSFRWCVANVWGNLVRWAVPVFFMISGTLFLQKQRDFKVICKKNIFRLVTAYLFWAVVYALAAGGTVENVITNTIQGSYHMWFVPAIIGVYLCIPILQKIAQSKSIMKYYLALSSCFVYIIPFVGQLLNDFGTDVNVSVLEACENFYINLNPYGITNYAVYFVAGYFLSNLKLDKKGEYSIYFWGILGFCMTIGLNTKISINLGYSVSNYQDSFAINVFLTSIAMFIWVKNHCSSMSRVARPIKKMSQYCFGAYLVHVAVIGRLESGFGLDVGDFPMVIAVPLLGIIVFALSMVISGVLNHIPVIKKYFV